MRLLFCFRMADTVIVKPMMKGHQRKRCVSRTLREDGQGAPSSVPIPNQVRQNLSLPLPDHYPPSLGDLGYPSRVAFLDLCLVTLVGITFTKHRESIIHPLDDAFLPRRRGHHLQKDPE